MNDALVKIASASNQAEAEMWRGLLASEGIDCLVRNVGTLLAYTPALSLHDIYVRPDDAPAASDLLAAFTEPIPSDSAQDEPW